MQIVYDAAQAAMQSIVDDINAGKYAKLAGKVAAISEDKRGIEVTSDGCTAGVGLTFIAYNSVDEVVTELASRLAFWINDDVAK